MQENFSSQQQREVGQLLPTLDMALECVRAGTLVRLYDDYGQCKRNQQKISINDSTLIVEWASEKYVASRRVSRAKLTGIYNAELDNLSLTLGVADVISRKGNRRPSQRLHVIMPDAKTRHMWIIACNSLLEISSASTAEPQLPPNPNEAMDRQSPAVSVGEISEQGVPRLGTERLDGVSKSEDGHKANTIIGMNIRERYHDTPAQCPPVFGVPLEAIDREPSDASPFVPLIIESLMIFLTGHKNLQLNIFQQTCNMDTVEALVQIIDDTDDMDFVSTHLENTPAVVILSILKMWLRELPEPLLTDDLFQYVIDSANHDYQTCKDILCSCMARLPLANFHVLRAFVQFLVAFAERLTSQAAETSLYLVAEHFTPLVLYSESEPVEHAQEDAPYRAKVFVILIEQHDHIFNSRLWHPDRIDKEVWAPHSAVTYVNMVKDAFGDDHSAVKKFVSIMGAFQDDRMDGYDAIVELEQIFTDHEKLGSSIIQTFMPNFAKAKAGYPIASMDTDEDVAETIEAQVCQGATVDAQGLKAGEAQPSASVRGIVESGMQTEFRRRVLIEYAASTIQAYARGLLTRKRSRSFRSSPTGRPTFARIVSEQTGQIYRMRKHSIIIGRHSHVDNSADISLDDSHVSERHVSIIYQATSQQFVLSCLSTKSLRVNDTIWTSRHDPFLLRTGDRICIGSSKLTFTSEHSTTARSVHEDHQLGGHAHKVGEGSIITQLLAGSSFKEGLSLRSDQSGTVYVDRPILSSSTPMTEPLRASSLAMLQASDGSTCYMAKTIIIMGRITKSTDSHDDVDCTIDYCGKSVSRRHAQIEYIVDDIDGDYFTIECLGRQGILVNGTRSTANIPMQLYSRSNIQIGDVVLQFVRAGDVTTYDEAASAIQNAYRRRLQRQQLHREARSERLSKYTQEQRRIEGMAMLNAAAAEARVTEARRRASDEARRLREAELEYAEILAGRATELSRNQISCRAPEDSKMLVQTTNGEHYEYSRDSGAVVHLRRSQNMSKDVAATKLQAWWRGETCRRELLALLLLQSSAVQRIEEAWLGYCETRLCRDAFQMQIALKKRQSNMTNLGQAAVKIQAAMRGKLVRDEMHIQLEARQQFSATELQAVCRMYLALKSWNPKLAARWYHQKHIDSPLSVRTNELPKFKKIALKKAAERRQHQVNSCGAPAQKRGVTTTVEQKLLCQSKTSEPQINLMLSREPRSGSEPSQNIDDREKNDIPVVLESGQKHYSSCAGSQDPDVEIDNKSPSTPHDSVCSTFEQEALIQPQAKFRFVRVPMSPDPMCGHLQKQSRSEHDSKLHGVAEPRSVQPSLSTSHEDLAADQTDFWIYLLSKHTLKNVLPRVIAIQRYARGHIVRRRNACVFQEALDAFTVDYSATYIQALTRGFLVRLRTDFSQNKKKCGIRFLRSALY